MISDENKCCENHSHFKKRRKKKSIRNEQCFEYRWQSEVWRKLNARRHSELRGKTSRYLIFIRRTKSVSNNLILSARDSIGKFLSTFTISSVFFPSSYKTRQNFQYRTLRKFSALCSYLPPFFHSFWITVVNRLSAFKDRELSITKNVYFCPTDGISTCC